MKFAFYSRIYATVFLAAITAAISFGAYAADVPASPRKSPLDTLYNWQGPSIWGTIGVVDSKSSNIVDTAGSYDKLKSHGYGWWKSYKLVSVPTSTPTAIDNTAKGLTLGGGAAYDWYVASNVLLGVEGNLHYSTASGCTNVGTNQFCRGMDILGFVGPRALLLITPTTAFIVKGGLGVGHFTQSFTGAGTTAGSSKTLAGWSAGGGIQQIVSEKHKAFAKIEATYTGFKDSMIDGVGLSQRNHVLGIFASVGKNF